MDPGRPAPGVLGIATLQITQIPFEIDQFGAWGNGAPGRHSSRSILAPHQRAAPALRRSEERFRALLAHSSDVVVVVGRDLRIIDATGPVERMLGRGPGDLAGSTLADLVFPQEWPGVEALLAEAVDLPGTTLTEDIRLRRGARGWLRSQTAVVSLLDDANVGGLVLTIQDVSERRALED